VYKNYKEHPEVLEKLQIEFDLVLTELEEDDWALLLEGGVVNIQGAVNWLHEKGKSRFDDKSRNINDCGICGMPLEESYRLFCEHRFCRECLIDYLHYSLGVMSQFPFLCPDVECRKKIACIDLEYLLDFSDWYKMRTIAANEFLKNSDEFEYCMTPGCEQINRLRNITLGGVRSEYIRCDICKNSYCLKCQVNTMTI
jgi:hypothetical protein